MPCTAPLQDLPADITELERQRLLAIFRDGVQRSGQGCWIWHRGFKSRDEKYGVIRFRGRSWRAHRLSYLLHKGPIVGLVRHTCGNSQCVNPDHLECGTHSDNLKDAYQHQARPKPRPLSESQRQQIIELRKICTVLQISQRMQVAQSTVIDCLNRVERLEVRGESQQKHSNGGPRNGQA